MALISSPSLFYLRSPQRMEATHLLIYRKWLKKLTGNFVMMMGKTQAANASYSVGMRFNSNSDNQASKLAWHGFPSVIAKFCVILHFYSYFVLYTLDFSSKARTRLMCGIILVLQNVVEEASKMRCRLSCKHFCERQKRSFHSDWLFQPTTDRFPSMDPSEQVSYQHGLPAYCYCHGQTYKDISNSGSVSCQHGGRGSWPVTVHHFHPFSSVTVQKPTKYWNLRDSRLPAPPLSPEGSYE